MSVANHAGACWNTQEDFQTRGHLPARTDDLFASVVIRGFRRVDLACPSGAGRIETHGSVRVEFESTRVVHTAQTRRKAYDPTGQHGFKSPTGFARSRAVLLRGAGSTARPAGRVPVLRPPLAVSAYEAAQQLQPPPAGPCWLCMGPQ